MAVATYFSSSDSPTVTGAWAPGLGTNGAAIGESVMIDEQRWLPNAFLTEVPKPCQFAAPAFPTGASCQGSLPSLRSSTSASNLTRKKPFPRRARESARLKFAVSYKGKKTDIKARFLKGSDFHISAVSHFVVPPVTLMQFGTEVTQVTASSLKSVCDRGPIHLASYDNSPTRRG